MLIIGDVHGKLQDYKKIVDSYKGLTIQLGDFGFREHHQWHLENLTSCRHRIIFGNHDDYSFLNEAHSYGNFSFFQSEDDSVIMTIRGAYSIDKAYRIEGVSYWNNEEMTYQEMQECISMYRLLKPSIVLSHTCPNVVQDELFGIKDKAITTIGMEVMFKYHQPSLWVFGHHHKKEKAVINDTCFVALDELGLYEI